MGSPSYVGSAAPGATSLWSLFTAKAELLSAAVAEAADEESALRIVAQAAGEFSVTSSVSERFPIVAAAAFSRVSAERTEVVAVGQFAVAETGSVALNEPAADRGACFLAERLWLLVPRCQIVASVDLGMQRMLALVKAGAHHPLLMSGPSRTADIERVLTIGVHGPRAVSIIIVGSA